MLLCVHTRYNPFTHPSCTSLLFILLFIKSQYTVFAHLICFALFILLHILLFIYLFFTYIYALVLCYFYIILIFILLHCPLSGPDLIYLSLLIIPCIIYYVTNKENLEPWTKTTWVKVLEYLILSQFLFREPWYSWMRENNIQHPHNPPPRVTWVKVLEYLILTVLKYFTYTKYRLKDALVKETSQSKTATLWRNWGKHAEARIYVKAFYGKTRTNNKTTTTGKQTTITFNNLQRTKETLGLCVYIYLDVVFTTSRCLNGLSCCHVFGWLAIKQVSLIKWPVSVYVYMHTHTHTHTHKQG